MSGGDVTAGLSGAGLVTRAIELFVDHTVGQVVDVHVSTGGRGWRELARGLRIETDDDRQLLQAPYRIHQAASRRQLPSYASAREHFDQAVLNRFDVVRRLANQVHHARLTWDEAFAVTTVIRMQWVGLGVDDADVHLMPLLDDARMRMEGVSAPKPTEISVDGVATAVADALHDSLAELIVHQSGTSEPKPAIDQEGVQGLFDRLEHGFQEVVQERLAAMLDELTASASVGAGGDAADDAVRRLEERLAGMDKLLRDTAARLERSGAATGLVPQLREELTAIDHSVTHVAGRLAGAARHAEEAAQAATSPGVRRPSLALLRRLRGLGFPGTGLHLVAAMAVEQAHLPIERTVLESAYRVAREAAAMHPELEPQSELVAAVASRLSTMSGP